MKLGSNGNGGFYVAEYDLTQNKVVVIDRSSDYFVLGQKHGFFCEESVRPVDTPQDSEDDDDFSGLLSLLED